MQAVSKLYKESMASPLRERSYMKIYFGLINQEAQNSARVDKSGTSAEYEYSESSDLFTNESDSNPEFATLEENFTKVNGSMCFQGTTDSSKEWISKDMLTGNNTVTFKIVFDQELPIDLKGITVDFGEAYPVDFDVVGDNNTVSITGNNVGTWKTEEVLRETKTLTFNFYKMKSNAMRVRIKSILCGLGLTYTNDSIINSTLETNVSPIGEDVPQIDFSVSLDNYGDETTGKRYFDVDDPESAINYFTDGQEIDVWYGYELPQQVETVDTTDAEPQIEWIKGCHLWATEWESDSTTATIKATDIFRNKESEYIKGVYDSTKPSFYTLAERIIADMGIEDYYIDPRMKNLYTDIPIPRVTHKEALQIIANACRCVLTQNRNGRIEIRSNFMPEVKYSVTDKASFVSTVNLLDSNGKKNYAWLSDDYIKVDGSQYFIEVVDSITDGGYISENYSKADCTFDGSPKVTLTMSAVRSYRTLTFKFGDCLPGEFKIETYFGSEIKNTFIVKSDEISQNCSIIRDYSDCDKIVIDFYKTQKPYNRIVVHHIGLEDNVDTKITKDDIIGDVTVTKQALVKEIIVPYYTCKIPRVSEEVVSETLTYTKEEKSPLWGTTQTYYFDEPYTNYSVKLSFESDDDDGTREYFWEFDPPKIIKQGAYFVTVTIPSNVTTDYNYPWELKISGYKVSLVEQKVTKYLNLKGKVVTWENPLISNYTQADELAGWIKDYYTSGAEYEYATRGNPELDATDILYQENDYHKDMKVVISKHIVEFGTGLSGQITARRKGD